MIYIPFYIKNITLTLAAFNLTHPVHYSYISYTAKISSVLYFVVTYDQTGRSYRLLIIDGLDLLITSC